MKAIRLILIISLFITLQSCASKSKLEVVKNFDSGKYLGKWYEIARLDYKWEKNLNNATAFYSLKDNGIIRVENKGFDFEDQKWKEATGKATFAGDKTEGRLKVSFFGPFYADYNIVAVDSGYNYALVIGSNTDYMWILSREPRIPDSIKKQYLTKAKELGIKTENLVWVEHNQTPKP